MKKILFFLVSFLSSSFFYGQSCGNLSFGTISVTGTEITIPVILTGSSTNSFLTFGVTVETDNSSEVTFDIPAMNNSIHTGLHSGFGVTQSSNTVKLSYSDFNNATNLPSSTLTLFNVIMEITPDECATLQFRINTGPGNSILWPDFSKCHFTNTPSTPSYNCGPAIDITGYVDYIQSTWELEDVSMEVRLSSGSVSGADITDSNGDYALLSLSPGEDYTVLPTKTDETDCGITSHDSYLVQQHILDNTFLSDKRAKMAADINLSSTITAFDVALINGQVNSGNNMPNSWYFVPDSDYATMSFDNSDNVPTYPNTETFNNVTSDVTNVFFYAVKTGDIDVSCNPTTSFREEMLSQSRNNTLLTIPNISATAYARVKIPVFLADFTNKAMLSISLEIDSDN